MFQPETKILVAEDMNSIREIIIEAFNKIGFHNVTGCKDGAEAWEKIQIESPSFKLIVSDMFMPNSTGMDLLVRIRSSERFNKLPFLMISEVAAQENIDSTLKAGADYYLVKPVKPQALGEVLKKIYTERYGLVG